MAEESVSQELYCIDWSEEDVEPKSARTERGRARLTLDAVDLEVGVDKVRRVGNDGRAA